MCWLLWTTVASILLLVLCIYKYYTGNDNFWPSRGVLLLNLGDVVSLWDRLLARQSFHEVEQKIYEAIRRHGAISFAGIMEFRTPTLIVVDLDLIKQILVGDFDHFMDRRHFASNNPDPYLNQMLLNLHGQEWKTLRSTLSPTFSTGKTRRMFHIVNSCSMKMVSYVNGQLADASGQNEVEIRDVCTRFTTEVIANAAFGVDSKMFEDVNSPFATMGKRFQAQFSGRLFAIKFFIARFVPGLLSLLRLTLLDVEATTFFANTVKSSVEFRRRSAVSQDDFLQLMIETQQGELKAAASKDQKSSKSSTLPEKPRKGTEVMLTDTALIAQSLFFFLAGFDTTETLLIFALYELAVNSDVQARLAEEVNEGFKNNEEKGTLAYESIASMPYLDMVISETMRKYPPARFERQCTKDYKIPGTNFTIKKDQVIRIPLMGIHQCEDYYQNPKKFDPERFSQEGKAGRHPYAYMPFGQGPRSCIAMRFALLEAKAGIAHMIHEFRLEACPKTPITMKFDKKCENLKPKGGLWLSITPRN